MADKSEEVTNVMAFDALYTTNQIQKLKILLPYIDSAIQKQLAVYIKYLELQYTMDYIKKHPIQICGCSREEIHPADLKKLCRQLCLYSTPDEIRQLEQLQSMLQAMENLQEMNQTLNTIRELYPDMEAPFSGDATDGSSSMLDMLMNMLTPEQKAMYEMFQQTE